MSQSLLRRIVRGAIAATSLSACVLRPTFTEAWGFRPRDMRDGRQTPAQWGWAAATLDTIARRDSAGGILAWWGPVGSGIAPCGGALLLHGKGKNRAEMLEIGQSLQGAGFSVLIPDYRGYGGSDGTPTAEGVFDDALLAYRSLQERLNDSTVPMLVVGHSMGTALAARVTREFQPAATIYMSPFSRISSLLRSQAGALGPRMFDTTVFAFNPAEDAASGSGRRMVLVGGRDYLIKSSESDAFVASLPGVPVIRVPRATHQGLLVAPQAVTAVRDSLSTWAGCPATAGQALQH